MKTILTLALLTAVSITSVDEEIKSVLGIVTTYTTTVRGN